MHVLTCIAALAALSQAAPIRPEFTFAYEFPPLPFPTAVNVAPLVSPSPDQEGSLVARAYTTTAARAARQYTAAGAQTTADSAVAPSFPTPTPAQSSFAAAGGGAGAGVNAPAGPQPPSDATAFSTGGRQASSTNDPSTPSGGNAGTSAAGEGSARLPAGGTPAVPIPMNINVYGQGQGHGQMQGAGPGRSPVGFGSASAGGSFTFGPFASGMHVDVYGQRQDDAVPGSFGVGAPGTAGSSTVASSASQNANSQHQGDSPGDGLLGGLGLRGRRTGTGGLGARQLPSSFFSGLSGTADNQDNGQAGSNGPFGNPFGGLGGPGSQGGGLNGPASSTGSLLGGFDGSDDRDTPTGAVRPFAGQVGGATAGKDDGQQNGPAAGAGGLAGVLTRGDSVNARGQLPATRPAAGFPTGMPVPSPLDVFTSLQSAGPQGGSA
ncbi:uncharacterized protein DSM5745_10463 [Aspergillus mulundensis]|uniref:Uncharacterized protein n=1 Tax=Aspergillus mulundensis TaxID=1810919 RepID=A0A3D8QJA0_9EURO|nr:hypothetical protein DSM5745_10463 [Aspergillus mulundensis]RDW61791.1 hypothetical protein DSM5745_10463 [Aspergillus mulundensis]